MRCRIYDCNFSFNHTAIFFLQCGADHIWVLSFPYPLRFLFASRPAIMSKVLGIVYRVIATNLTKKGGIFLKTAHTGAVTFIQRARSALTKSPGAILSRCMPG